MNSTNDNDFTQFEGAFDFSQAPDPTFAEMLRRRMDAERADKPIQSATVLASPPANSPRVREAKPSAVPPPSRRPIWAAVAALLVVTIIGASVWQIGGLMNEGQYAGAPEVVLPVDASVTPGPDVELTATQLVHTSGLYHSYEVFGDVIIGNGFLVASDQQFDRVHVHAIDIETGEELWEYPDWYVYYATWDGTYVYLLKEVEPYLPSFEEEMFFVEPSDGEETQIIDGLSLVALEPRSGAVVWEYEVPPVTSQFPGLLFWTQPMAEDGRIYLSTWNSVIAIDTTNGTKLWETSTRLPVPDIHDLSELTIYREDVVLVGTQGFVLVFDATTGRITAHHQIDLTTYFRTNYNVYVGSAEEGIVAVFTGTPVKDTEGVTMLIDPLEGEVLTAVGTDATSGRNAFAADGSVAFVPNKWNAGNILMQILGRGSYTTTSLIWIDAIGGQVRLNTEYTRVGDTFSAAVANDGEFVCYASQALGCYDQNGTYFPVTNAVLAGTVLRDSDERTVSDAQVYWMEISNGRLYYSTDDGIFVVDLP